MSASALFFSLAAVRDLSPLIGELIKNPSSIFFSSPSGCLTGLGRVAEK